MVVLGPEVRAERYRGSEWTYLRGEGPTDLILKASPTGTLADALLTFAADGLYCEVIYNEGRVKVGRMTTSAGEEQTSRAGSRMPADPVEAERHILRHAAFLIMASDIDTKKLAQPMLQAMIGRT